MSTMWTAPKPNSPSVYVDQYNGCGFPLACAVVSCGDGFFLSFKFKKRKVSYTLQSSKQSKQLKGDCFLKEDGRYGKKLHLPFITVFLHFPAISKLCDTDKCTIGQGQIIFTIVIEVTTHAMYLQMNKKHILSTICSTSASPITSYSLPMKCWW